MEKDIYGLVLAAGLSSRMGRTKQLLPFGHKTILQTVVDVLMKLSLTRIVVVLGHEAPKVRESLADRNVICCFNKDYVEGMFSSVLVGLDEIPSTADAVLISLGDQPHIEESVGRAVLDAYLADEAGIVIPSWNGKRGHPVAIDLRRYRTEIMSMDRTEGLKPFMRGHAGDTLELPVGDSGILRDLDTPDQYLAELKKFER
jgi:molybdenum cofactor cytidylyltransferase